MDLWEKALAELVDIVEWIDESSDTMVWRFPRYENEIKYGAQLIVRQAQAAVFVNMGRIADVFPPGQYQLTTKNLPILSTIMGWKYGFHSPFKAEVYFVSTRNFTNLKWGTKNPVIMSDPEFGPVRLRAYGTFVVKVSDPARFINEIAGTEGHFTLEEISEQLRNLIITRFSDTLGERKIPVVSLAASLNDISQFLTEKISPEFQEYGLEITKLLVENISLPAEVEEALDKRSSMGIIGSMDNYLKYQSANAMETAAANPGGEASAGVGLGMGFAMANQMGKMMTDNQSAQKPSPIPPPLPLEEAECNYYAGKNGKKAGPFNRNTVFDYIRKGAITKDTLMWKEGMADWQAAERFPEFQPLLNTLPPPLPK
jgi:membrane protease subunit (stomatin/prohibitin family)